MAPRCFGLTTPLLTTASGRKMGKTETGAVWLNAELCNAYDYWQYWRNVEDADVPRAAGALHTPSDVGGAPSRGAGGAEINEAKKVLATEATAWLHGEAAAAAAAETARRTFEEGAAAAGLPSIASARRGSQRVFRCWTHC